MIEQRVITFETTDPVVMASGPSSGNTVHTDDFVPGTAIRGALAGRILRRQPPNDEFTRLFEIAVRCEDGHPSVVSRGDDGTITGIERSTPIPSSRRICKYECGTAVDLAAIHLWDEVFPNACSKCGAPLKATTGWEDHEGRPVRTQTELLGKTELVGPGSREYGTARDESLRFDVAISCGQTFTAPLIGEGGDLDRLLEMANFNMGDSIRVGRSKSTQGGLKVIAIESHPIDPLGGDMSGGLVVTLMSRAIIVDPFLRPTTELPNITGLSDRKESDDIDGAGDPIRWMATEMVTGWNAGQALPKPTDRALSRGSVFTFEATDDGDGYLEELSGWFERGIGLRRSEGFGSVRVQALPDILFEGER